MDRLVALAVNRRYLMVAMFVVVMIGGLLAFRQLNIEAYPDPTPPMVDIVTQSPGLSAEEIERYITIPIETQVAGIKNLKTSAPSRCTACPTSSCSSPSTTPMTRRSSRGSIACRSSRRCPARRGSTSYLTMRTQTSAPRASSSGRAAPRPSEPSSAG